MKTAGIKFCYKKRSDHPHEKVNIHINTSRKTSTVQIVKNRRMRHFLKKTWQSSHGHLWSREAWNSEILNYLSVIILYYWPNINTKYKNSLAIFCKNLNHKMSILTVLKLNILLTLQALNYSYENYGDAVYNNFYITRGQSSISLTKWMQILLDWAKTRNSRVAFDTYNFGCMLTLT